MKTKGSQTIHMTQGNPVQLLIRFAIPMLIGNLFQQAYNLTDSMIVGQLLGSGALAAVGATGSVTFLFFSLCSGVAAGAGMAYRIVRSLEQSYMQFDRGVCLTAWGLGALITLAFSLIVNGIALRKVKDLKLTDVT